jgi:hypothetical protein
MSATRRPDDRTPERGIERGSRRRDESICVEIVRTARNMAESRLLVPNEIYLPMNIWQVLLRYIMERRLNNVGDDIRINQNAQSFAFQNVTLKNHSSDNFIFVHCYDRAVFILELHPNNTVTFRNFMAINEIERSNDRPGTRYEVESLRPVERVVDTPRNEGRPMTPNV